MSALTIACITFKNPHKFQDYLTGSNALAARFGAELIGQGRAVRALHGKGNHELVVVAHFPNAANFDSLFDTHVYQPLVSLRDEGTDMRMTSYEVIS